MPPEDRDIALLWDMREAARDITEFMQGITFFHFNSNKMLRYAVERQLVVIGEAANHVSGTFKKVHPEIPWKGIIANAMFWRTSTEKYWLSVSGLWPLNAFPSI